MKFLKIIIGILASLYAVAQVVHLINAMSSPARYSSTFEVSRYGGIIAGICIGFAVAVACFKSAR